MKPNLNKAIAKAVLFPQKPSHLILHVTGRCTQRCRTCFIDFDSYKEKDDLSLAEIKNIAAYLDSLVWLDLSGGEPFLRKDLPEICAAFNVPAISIPTNGFNPDIIAQTTKRIKESSNSEVCIAVSLDGFEATNDYIRAPGAFGRVIKTIEALKKIEGIRIKVNTVLCNKNLGEIIYFMKFIKGFELDFHSIIFQRGSQPANDFLCPSAEKLLEIKDKIFEIWKTYDYGVRGFGRVVLQSYQKELYNASLKVMQEKQQIPKCLAHNKHLVIYPHGEAAFCEMLPCFGNIRQVPLKELLLSSNAQKQRQSIKQKKCYCYHNCNMIDNFFFNPFLYPKVILSSIWPR